MVSAYFRRSPATVHVSKSRKLAICVKCIGNAKPPHILSGVVYPGRE